ncbi:MAG: hypothetical protein IT162_08720 [Bryobacterales bacterium]|nr:hypothetical protein [Bryobacterales bacterium]
MTHSDLSSFVPADWQVRVSGPSCLLSIPGWENKGYIQVLLHRGCTHRGEGAAILREMEQFCERQSAGLSGRRGPEWLSPAAASTLQFANSRR